MARVIVKSKEDSYPGKAMSLTKDGAILHLEELSPKLIPGEMTLVVAEEATYQGKIIFREVHADSCRLHVRFLN